MDDDVTGFVNIQYINPLLESTVTVLSTMAMIDAIPGKPALKSNDTPLGAVTGIIDLKSSEASGSLAISFSRPAILDITARMLGEQLDAIDDTVVDVVGEITNMITGNAKRIFSEHGLEFELTLPSTIVGQSQPIVHSAGGQPILLPFSSAAGDIFVEVCFS